MKNFQKCFENTLNYIFFNSGRLPCARCDLHSRRRRRSLPLEYYMIYTSKLFHTGTHTRAYNITVNYWYCSYYWFAKSLICTNLCLKFRLMALLWSVSYRIVILITYYYSVLEPILAFISLNKLNKNAAESLLGRWVPTTSRLGKDTLG